MYDLVLEDIEGVFASAPWTTNGILTVPSNYQGTKNNAREYCLMTVLPSSGSDYDYSRNKLLSGTVAIKIFVPAGSGQGRLMAIADLLNSVLENTTLTNNTRLGKSYLQVEGLDAANKSLYSASYFIPFTLYGE
jgi:hypothetical protein